jgi:predicted transcriptional regulator
MFNMRTPFELERIVKGCANHRRIEMLILLARTPRLTLDEIAGELGIDFRVASEHARRMAAGGLVQKKYRGRYVEHTLTERARDILTFLRKLE